MQARLPSLLAYACFRLSSIHYLSIKTRIVISDALGFALIDALKSFLSYNQLLIILYVLYIYACADSSHSWTRQT